MVRAALYVRISRDSAKEGLGVARQEKDCRERAASLGWTVSEVYVDNDLSASTGKPRPGYLRMLAAMERREFDAVIAWHPDRLYRRPDDLENLIGIADAAGVTFSTCRAGEIDLSTASGRLVARLLGAVARHEVELKGERQAAKIRELAVAGKITGGGHRPFGWNEDRLTIDEDEAAIVRELAERALAGQSIFGLCEWLTAEGVLTTIGSDRWSSVTVRRMLLSPRLAGLSVYRGEVVGRGEWEPILSEETHRRLVEKLGKKAARRSRPRIALMSASLMKCGLCGYSLSTFRRSAKRGHQRVYGCREATLTGRPGFGKACSGIAIAAEKLEDDIAMRVLARILSQREVLARAAEAVAEPDNVAGQLGDLERRLEQLGIDYADGVLGRVEFIAARDRIAERIDSARSALAKAEGASIPGGSLDELVAWWEAAPLDARRTVVEGQIRSVRINPHSGGRAYHDPRRVLVEWR